MIHEFTRAANANAAHHFVFELSTNLTSMVQKVHFAFSKHIVVFFMVVQFYLATPLHMLNNLRSQKNNN